MKLIELIECEDKIDYVVHLHKCIINPKYIKYVSPHDEHKGYSYIGIGDGVTLVKGSVEEIRAKIEGKKWHKILRQQWLFILGSMIRKHKPTKQVSKPRSTKARTAK